MKCVKNKMTAILLASTLLLALAGCGNGTGGDNDGFTPDDSMISELYAEEGSYADEWENQYEYSWYVPQLNDESEAAEAINAYIRDSFGTLVEEEKSKMELQASMDYTDIAWERFWNESRLFLKLTADCGSWKEIDVVCYDFAEKKQLTTADIIKDAGLTEETYLAALKRAAFDCFDTAYTDNMTADEYYEEFGGYLFRAECASEEYINMQQPVYIDGEERLKAIIPIPSIAGAAYYLQEVTIDTEQNGEETLRAEDGFVSAVLEDGKLSLSFTENEDSEMILGGYTNAPEYGKAYEVNDIYGNYTQIVIASMGNNIAPCVFLLTSEGRVELVNVMAGIPEAYFSSDGVLPGVKGVKALYPEAVIDEYGGYHTIFAELENGEKQELTLEVIAADNAHIVPVVSMLSGYLNQVRAEDPGNKNFPVA